MVRRVTSKLEPLNGGPYCRLYLRSKLALDDAFPFRPDAPVRVQIVPAVGDKEVLVVVPEPLEVDADATSIQLRRSRAEVQTDLAGGSS